MWARWWSRWARRRSAPSIRSTRFWRLRERYGFRVHVDAAYGGYFGLIPEALDEPARRPTRRSAGRLDRDRSAQAWTAALRLRVRAVPRPGGGAVLQARFAVHLLHFEGIASGEISLECSRAGAAAVALWATQQLLPLTPGGEFARGLAQGRRAALELDRRLRADERFVALAAGPPELDIVVWAAARMQQTFGQASERAQAVFDACAARGLHLALVQLPRFVVWRQRRRQNRDEPGARDLPALGADEAGARGVAGRDLGTAERSLR